MRFSRTWFRKEVAPILLALVLVTAARSSLADHYYVPSGSMENTLFAGDRVVVDKTAYGVPIPYTKVDVIEGAHPKPGEVAVFDSPADGTLLIKRIVAVGGQMVTRAEGNFYHRASPTATRWFAIYSRGAAGSSEGFATLADFTSATGRDRRSVLVEQAASPVHDDYSLRSATASRQTSIAVPVPAQIAGVSDLTTGEVSLGARFR